MGLREFFEIKSLKQKKAEQQQYNAWAFPYGRRQYEIINDRILAMMPDEKKTGMAVYLLGREAFQTAKEDPIGAAAGTMKAQLPGKHKKKVYCFLALILADAQVNENLAYPQAEELLAEAKRLEETL